VNPALAHFLELLGASDRPVIGGSAEPNRTGSLSVAIRPVHRQYCQVRIFKEKFRGDSAIWQANTLPRDLRGD
jgi:hypothetical protein